MLKIYVVNFRFVRVFPDVFVGTCASLAVVPHVPGISTSSEWNLRCGCDTPVELGATKGPHTKLACYVIRERAKGNQKTLRINRKVELSV